MNTQPFTHRHTHLKSSTRSECVSPPAFHLAAVEELLNNTLAFWAVFKFSCTQFVCVCVWCVLMRMVFSLLGQGGGVCSHKRLPVNCEAEMVNMQCAATVRVYQ